MGCSEHYGDIVRITEMIIPDATASVTTSAAISQDGLTNQPIEKKPISEKTTIVATPSEDDYRYLAGIYEGEGSLGAYLQGYCKILRRPQIELRIEMYDRDIIEWIARTFAGNLTPRKRASQVSFSQAMIPIILKGMLPHMRGRRRREQAAHCFKLLEAKKQVLSRKDEHRRQLLHDMADKVNSYNYGSGKRTRRDCTVSSYNGDDLVQTSSTKAVEVSVLTTE